MIDDYTGAQQADGLSQAEPVVSALTGFDPSRIPHGPYCYGSLGRMDERGNMKVNGACPYRERRGNGEAFCLFLNATDEFGMLDDQVKICGINDGEPHHSTIVGGDVEMLLDALEPFAEVDGEGDEDFPDETPAIVTFGRSTVYSLTLGDFRRARTAASAIEAATAGETTQIGSTEGESATRQGDAQKAPQ